MVSKKSNVKTSSVAYLLWLLSCFGILGFYRFYLSKIVTGLLWFLTGGLFGFGTFFDLFTLAGQVDRYNKNMELKVIKATRISNSKSTNRLFFNLGNKYVEPNQDEQNKTLEIKSHHEKIEVLMSKGFIRQSN